MRTLVTALLSLAAACTAEPGSDEIDRGGGAAFDPSGSWTVRWSPGCAGQQTRTFEVSYVADRWDETSVSGDFTVTGTAGEDCRLSVYLDDAPANAERLEISCGRYADGNATWIVLADNGTTATAHVDLWRAGACSYNGAATVVSRTR